jgi:hypothetical protein
VDTAPSVYSDIRSARTAVAIDGLLPPLCQGSSLFLNF